MNDQSLNQCDLLVKNRAAIQKSFLLEKELMAVIKTDEKDGEQKK
jgi:hypothetical protein